MPDQYLPIDDDLSEETFSFIPNHLNPSAAWSWDEGSSCLFEPHGDELAFIKSQDPATVWTLIATGDALCIFSGYQTKNRVGHLVSTSPVPGGIRLRIPVPSPVSE